MIYRLRLRTGTIFLQHLQGRHPLVGQHKQPLGRNLAACAQLEQLGALDQVLDLAAIDG